MNSTEDVNGSALVGRLRVALTGHGPDTVAACPVGPDIPAAVLVPVLSGGLHGGGAPTILFTKRTAQLANHAGQISFPGGRIEVHDCDPVDAALRESEEEIALSAGAVEVLGVLEPRPTRTGFVITPVVGLIGGPFSPRPDPAEVAYAFDVPLEFLMDTANHERIAFEREGRMRKSWAMSYMEHYIWGATAGILKSLSDLLELQQGERP